MVARPRFAPALLIALSARATLSHPQRSTMRFNAALSPRTHARAYSSHAAFNCARFGIGPILS